MASFTSSIDITNGGTYPLNISNGMTHSAMRDSINGKMGQIQTYLQNDLPEVCDTLPTELTKGKLIIYNNQLYVGNSDNVPVQIEFEDLVVNHSISMGRVSGKTIGQQSVAVGVSVQATDYGAFAEGVGTQALAYAAHAEGYGSKAKETASHAEGRSCEAGGNDHAEGQECIASGGCSHAEGNNARASGMGAHAEGSYTQAIGSDSHAGGYGTKATDFAHVSGKNNKELTDNGPLAYNTGDAFAIGNGTSNYRSNAFRITFSGQTYGKSSFNSTGADYAEYFEWLDGNPDNKDRVGYFVTMDGKNIRIASPGDYILGIVSGQPCIIGNADEDWLGRWEHDEYGRSIKEYFENEEIEIDTKNMNEEEICNLYKEPDIKKKDSKFYRMISKPVDYKTPFYNFKANPNYDSSQPYIERKDRKEWSAIGMVGVLSVRDDGTCKVNSYCKVADNGIATSADGCALGTYGTYRVIERVSDNVIRVVFK